MSLELREAWLMEAVVRITPLLTSAGLEVPPLRVSCGWPHRGGLSETRRVVGQCWLPESAADGKPQVYISPWLGEAVAALEVLVHEVIHACLPADAKHGKVFAKAATDVGLIGKPTHTSAGPELKVVLAQIAEDLGPYPHAKLDKVAGEKKPQTTRQKKIVCPKAKDLHEGGEEYILRGSRKVIEMGLPDCPVCGEGLVATDGTEGDEGEKDA